MLSRSLFSFAQELRDRDGVVEESCRELLELVCQEKRDYAMFSVRLHATR